MSSHSGEQDQRQELTHLDDQGAAHMVDVGGKTAAARQAVAHAELHMLPATAALLSDGELPKGDAVAVARVAGIMAAKQTPSLIPLCHPIALSRAAVDFDIDTERGRVDVWASTATVDRTGVEMEALTAVSVAALTVYDMVKSVERGVRITQIELVEKSGGRSGHWVREDGSRKDRG